MAKYHRAFLVPYLHDICALYLADQKLENEIFRKQNLIRQYRSRRHVPKPAQPRYENESGNGLALLGLLMACLGVVGLVTVFTNPEGMGQMPLGFGIFACLFWIVLGGAVYYGIAKNNYGVRERNETAKVNYEQSLQDYEQELVKAEQEQARRVMLIPNLERDINDLQIEQRKAQQTLRYVYAANVIPNHYRNFYAAIFLYDWFSSGGSNDMDMALNTFVLEEIKERLDIIIEQQAQIILNQRINLANQQKSRDEQDRHNRLMRRKMEQIQATQQERLRYDKMIEANTAATAYFAAAKYFK